MLHQRIEQWKDKGNVPLVWDVIRRGKTWRNFAKRSCSLLNERRPHEVENADRQRIAHAQIAFDKAIKIHQK